jgi:hypothetical protein
MHSYPSALLFALLLPMMATPKLVRELLMAVPWEDPVVRLAAAAAIAALLLRGGRLRVRLRWG